MTDASPAAPFRSIARIALALTVVFGLTACEENQSAREKDEKTSEQLLKDLQRAHPTPKFRRSQPAARRLSASRTARTTTNTVLRRRPRRGS